MTDFSRITHVLYSGLGGHGSVVFSYLKDPLLSSAEHKLLFFGVEEVTDEYKKICAERNIEFSFIKKKRLRGISSAFKLYRELKKQKADMIVVHSLSVIQVAALYKFLHKAKLILVEHASLVLKRKIDILYTKMGFSVADKIVYLTNVNFEESQDRFGDSYKKDQALIISNGIDTREFSPAEHNNKSHINIGIHCRFVKVKDLPTLIEAFAILQGNCRDNVLLNIAGDGSIKTDLEKLVKQKNLEGKVLFTGLLNKDQVIEFLRETDIYVNTSKIESMSTSIMQAMSCGLPIIASNIPGNLGLVKDEENGLIFELSNTEDLAEKLQMLCEDKEMRISFGKNSREIALEKLSDEIALNNYNELFESVINGV